jgi:hypothetical protein
LLNSYYQTAPTIHHLAYNYLIHAERAHCSDDKCLRERGHPGLPPWPEHLAVPVFPDDNSAIWAITSALAVRHFAQRILADFIREDAGRQWAKLQRADRLTHALTTEVYVAEQLKDYDAATLREAVDKFAESPTEHSSLLRIVDLLEQRQRRPDQSLLFGPKL